MTSQPSAVRDDAPSGARLTGLILAVVVIAVVSGYVLRLPAGDDRFIPGTVVMAVLLFGAAFALGTRWVPAGAAAWRLGAAAGVGLALAFVAGAFVLVQIPALAQPVRELVDHTAGSLALVLPLTLINGCAEEAFYRGAVYDQLGRWAAARGKPDWWWPALGSTVLYTAVAAASGILMLAAAAFAMGTVTAWIRHRTGSWGPPMLTHALWSIAMLLVLPAVL